MAGALHHRKGDGRLLAVMETIDTPPPPLHTKDVRWCTLGNASLRRKDRQTFGGMFTRDKEGLYTGDAGGRSPGSAAPWQAGAAPRSWPASAAKQSARRGLVGGEGSSEDGASTNSMYTDDDEDAAEMRRHGIKVTSAAHRETQPWCQIIVVFQKFHFFGVALGFLIWRRRAAMLSMETP